MGDDTSHLLDRRSFLQATGAAGAAAALGGASVASADGPTDEEDRIYVGVSAGGSMDDVEASVPSDATVVERNENLRYLVVEPDEGMGTYRQMTVESTIASHDSTTYTEDGATYYAHDLEVEFDVDPNDPRFDGQYAPQQTRAPKAWETTFGSDDVTIAVVDQGVKYDHPDLEARFGSNKGRDFVDGDGDPYPEDLREEIHGTHVAGIAAASVDNGVGVAGQGNSRLLSCRALGTGGGGGLNSIANAVEWAADQGADVINMSLGGGGFRQTMKNAMSYAVNNGALPLASAGNDGSRGVAYPSAYEEVVCVSAVDDDENLANFSQYGPKVDVTGPGVDVLSTWPDPSQEYNRISGTSMSCPAASGVAALGKAADPGLGVEELRQRLKQTAADVGLSDEEQGAGRVDAANIVNVGPTPEDPDASFTASSTAVEPGEEVTFDASASSDPDGSIAGYQWVFGDGSSATGQVVSHSYSNTGDFTVELTVTDDDGNSDNAVRTIDVSRDGGGGGGECGDARNTTTKSGRLSGTGDAAEFDYVTQLQGPCTFSMDLSAGGDTDFDLYLTLDGRTPTTSDYDERSYNYGSDESITVEEGLSQGQDLGLLVHSYRGSGEFELAIEEVGKGDDGGGGGNESPDATFRVSSKTVEAGEEVTFDASGSSDPDGRIVSYRWEFGDGTTASGATASHVYDEAGSYTAALEVVDNDGAGATAQETLTVEDGGGGGGECGAVTGGASTQSSLSGYWDSDSYAYTAQTANPCQLTVDLVAVSGTDFDLYVTADGRTPTTSDYDRRSIGPDSDERVSLEEFGPEVGILVDSWSGSGTYEITVEELGK